MNRDAMLRAVDAQGKDPWDVAIIGGGASGLGIAVDAATRGYRTLLLEQSDFAKGTSSRSTKLVHGGVRYLAQGDIALVREALHERGLLLRNAPHLVHSRAFIIPTYAWWEGPYYTVGMKVYDAMAGQLGLGPSTHLSAEKTLAAIPNLDRKDLRGGVVYHDGQFDDARLAINLAQTAADHGATLLNHTAVTSLHKNTSGKIAGLAARDAESGKTFLINARAVINATGVFVDAVARMDDPAAQPLVALSQGVHVILSKAFLRGDSAIMIPQTDDGRVLFAVPWHDRVIVGTTDTPVSNPTLEPRALDAEIDFILNTVARYLTHDPTRADVLSIFAGLRPLAAPAHAGEATREISRGHRVLIAPSGLVTIVGGKWTTYRRMAADVLDATQSSAGLPKKTCRTESLRIHGATTPAPTDADGLSGYGSDAAALRALIAADPTLGNPLHARLPYCDAQVVWACREEMARTVEDVLARRTRALFLDARASMEVAPHVAELMRRELQRDAAWGQAQVEDYTSLAKGYVLA
ncbi:MAG: glycerol-3-phosphate dehydrogenase/oxidase [Verrucomicrobia bacterium]|nr:glycerol-3-phosphate dehydrogenase/oxidase [Verrucomicrobiota bacterium]